MNSITHINDESLFKTPYLSVTKTSYLDTQEKPREWYWVSRSKLMTAVVIAAAVEFCNKPHLLVTQEYRIPIKDYEWGFPAGLMFSGDSVLSCAKRGLLEETGYQIDSVIDSSPTLFSSAGLTNESCYLVRCTATKHQNQNMSDNKEIIVHIMSPIEVRTILEDRTNFISARAYPIMYEFAWYGTINPNTKQ
jgi:ADP-ribose pyrophosphatase